MSLVCLCSAHGSPGVTTTALALAASWPEDRRCLLVEADSFGGVIGARYGLGDTPGLSSLAAIARRGLDGEAVWRHAQRLPGGVPLLVGPASADEAHAVLRDVAGVLAGWGSDRSGPDVIADCGRVGPGSPAFGLVARADVAMVLVRPSVDQLRSAAHRLAALEMVGVEASLLLIGDRPYRPDEVVSTLRAEVVGVIAWDPRTAAALEGLEGGGRDLRMSPLVRSAATLAEKLAAVLPGPDGEVSVGGRSDLEVGVGKEGRR